MSVSQAPTSKSSHRTSGARPIVANDHLPLDLQQLLDDLAPGLRARAYSVQTPKSGQ